MPQATLSITANNVVTPVGGLSIGNLYIVASNPVFGSTPLTFSGPGFQSVPVPAGATWAIIAPPPLQNPANTAVLTLKGPTGDTGIPISNFQPFVLALGSTATTIGLNASAAITGGPVTVEFN